MKREHRVKIACAAGTMAFLCGATAFAAQACFEKLLAKGASGLPDLLYFSDDYVCQGALLALARHGIDVPRDVKVVTWSNRGNGPVFPFPLDYARMDPRADGRQVAELCGLQEEKGRGSATIDSRYVRGRAG